MQDADFFSLHALLSVFGWAVATGMGIRHLHTAEGNRVLTTTLIILCIIGVAGSWFQGAREHSDARGAQDQQRTISDGLDKLQKSLSLNNPTPDEILAAAASKLQQQNHEIDDARLRIAALEHPPHDPSMLYQGGMPIASTGVVTTNNQKQISFNIITSSREVDFTKTFEFQYWRVKCAGTPDGMMTYGAMRSINYVNVICEVLGNR